MGRTAPLTSKRCILYIYSTNLGTEYFKHALYSPFFPLQNAVCFIMLTCLVPVLFTFYIQGVLKLKKNISGAKGLTTSVYHLACRFGCHGFETETAGKNASRSIETFVPQWTGGVLVISTLHVRSRATTLHCVRPPY